MTLEQIEQRLSELKEEQDKLTAELERLKAEQTKVKPWRAEKNAGYYILQDNGDICCFEETGFVIDTTRHKIGNYYRTRKLAEQDAKELALRGRVRQLRDALCDGYQPSLGETSWSVIRCLEDFGRFDIGSASTYSSIGEIYFDTEEHAQQACDILNTEMKRDG